jgi:hypothetical protein
MPAASTKRYESSSENPRANLAASPTAKHISGVHPPDLQAAIS